jgi:hypothetical protein
MTAVEAEPMKVGHNYPSKDILLMRIAEEANLHNVEAATIRSCDKRVFFQGRAGAVFTVKARHSEEKNWTVKEYVHWTVPALPPMDNFDEVNKAGDDGDNNEEEDNDEEEEKDDNEDFYSDDPDDFEDGDDDGEDGDDIIGEEGDGDGIPKAKKRRKRKTTPKRRSPIKSRWLVPLIKQRVSECPNISNKECAHLLRLHVRLDFLTKTLLQRAKKACKFELFGNPSENAQYTKAMLREMTVRGHKVKSITKSAADVMAMLEKIVVQEEADRLQAKDGTTMTREMKKKYANDWIHINNEMLQEGGLGIQMIGAPIPEFCVGVFFSMSYSTSVVPHLQDVFQADAAHMNFGKYTLFSCYGSTANANTSPIAFAILFGNEDKAGWQAFWEFAKEQHPCLNAFNKTIITDQAKGLVDSVKLVLPTAGHFHCSYHRRKNIEKYCKGGKKMYSGLWLYDRLLGARKKDDIDKIKSETAIYMNTKTLNYVNALNDHEQFPGARCSQAENIYMYGRTASSSVESMNQANKPARDRTAVDLMQSMKLIVDLETRRFNEKKEMAHGWPDTLTPHGNKLRDEIFSKVDFHDYHIVVGDYDDKWVCRVSYLNKIERRTYFVKTPVMGSHFGGCTCGKANTESVPCHHMVAVVKSARVAGLTPTNCMPKWYTTEMWRLQYPMDQHSLCDFSIESLKQSELPQTSMRYCPPYSAPNKAGRPKEGKRTKGILEERKPKRRKGTAKEAAGDWNSKHDKGKQSR